MSRTRKRRVTCEDDLLVGQEKNVGGIFGDANNQRVLYMEDTDYKMEENC
jgi:hypothetical protein